MTNRSTSAPNVTIGEVKVLSRTNPSVNTQAVHEVCTYFYCADELVCQFHSSNTFNFASPKMCTKLAVILVIKSGEMTAK